MKTNIGSVIMNKRKALGLTQQNIADTLHVSFQAVSKWENGSAKPDIELLPQLAMVLGTTVDALLGYSSMPVTDYEERYKAKEYYWGLNPNKLCYDIMRLRPPVQPYRVLDIGCGEGKDAVFLAKNGYLVSAFDIAESGLEKGYELASKSNVHVDFFRANIFDYRLDMDYDIIFCSGVFHYIPQVLRSGFISHLKAHTKVGGLNVVNTFVDKPFIEEVPDRGNDEMNSHRWCSGELFTYYGDWLFYQNTEDIFDCNSGGIPHRHCMDTLIAEKQI